MSTKTLRKRIALVAVSALTAGVMSVATAPVASAGQGDYAANTPTNNSIGLLAAPTFVDGSTTMTATLLSTGRLNLTTPNSTGYYVVSAGASITSATVVGNISADQKKYTSAANDAFAVVPSGAVGTTFTISGYTSNTMASLTSRITVTIAGSSVAGVVAPSESGAWWVTNDSTEATADAATKNTATATNSLFLDVDVADAYGSPITVGTGSLIATATTGAFVSIGTATVALGTFSQAVSSANPNTAFIRVSEATIGAGWSGTVTVTYNGVVIATKSGTITGAPAKITITPKKVGKNNGSTTSEALDYQVTDVAGNIVVVSSGSITFGASSNTAIISGAAGESANSTSAAGKATVTCVSGATGTANVSVQTLVAGIPLLSNSVPVTCGGAAVTYTASWDKATYSQGDIAKLTVSFKDAKGVAANSIDAVSNASAGTSSDIVITANQLERVTAHVASTKTDVNGNVVYTFTVGTSSGVVAGKYQALVSFPTQALGTTQTVGYEVLGKTGVTNEDVLKSIVSLIASINKQIQALQKLILRR
jgi:trimeric autotransporter adhesin